MPGEVGTVEGVHLPLALQLARLPRTLPDAAYDVLSANSTVRAVLAANRAVPGERRSHWTRDRAARVRAAALSSVETVTASHVDAATTITEQLALAANPATPGAVLAAYGTIGHTKLTVTVLTNPATPDDAVRAILDTTRPETLFGPRPESTQRELVIGVTGDICDTHPQALHAWASSTVAPVQRAIARRRIDDPATVAALLGTNRSVVRTEIATNPYISDATLTAGITLAGPAVTNASWSAMARARTQMQAITGPHRDGRARTIRELAAACELGGPAVHHALAQNLETRTTAAIQACAPSGDLTGLAADASAVFDGLIATHTAAADAVARAADAVLWAAPEGGSTVQAGIRRLAVGRREAIRRRMRHADPDSIRFADQRFIDAAIVGCGNDTGRWELLLALAADWAGDPYDLIEVAGLI